MIGVSNKQWVPCVFDGSSDNSASKVIESVQNVGGTDFYFYYTLPLPTNRGGLGLRVDTVMVLMKDADANNKLTMVKVLGHTYNTSTTLMNNNTDHYSIEPLEIGSFTTETAYLHNIIQVALYANVSSVSDLKVLGVLLRCYYDTI